MHVAIRDGGRTYLIAAPEGSKVWWPGPEVYDLLLPGEDMEGLSELLKVPDGKGGWHRLPRSLVPEIARTGRFGLQLISVEEHDSVDASKPQGEG